MEVHETTDVEAVMGELGFCGCGRPIGVLRHIHGAMSILRDRDEQESGMTWHEWWELRKKRIRDHFSSDGAEYFMWYWLHKEGYTEHGGSVPGWLTDKGVDLLDALSDILAKQDAALGDDD